MGAEAMAQQGTDLYSYHEASLDTFGFYSSQNKGGHQGDTWGLGVAGNYFFTQNFGASAETYMDAFTIPYLLNLNAIYRFPLKQSALAPYGFAGFGRQWDHAAQWLGDLGVGIEYRFRPQMGAFFDARGVFPSETKDYAVLRFGFRFLFK